MASSSSSKQSEIARKQFELENNVETIDQDAMYKYDYAQQQAILQASPWKEDPKYFKHVKISALALLKMVMHTRSGKNLEVMGLMQGMIHGQTFIVTDAFALPVEGTETRVAAAQEAIEYSSQYINLINKVGRNENVVGWYHSHPGYGCWMSGIDVSTQLINQKYQDPFVAIVVDPVRTVSSGKVEIGAFRTYPEGYKPAEIEPSEYQSIPSNKIEDFGVHANSYYPLPVSYFKSSTDTDVLNLLWNKYWINTLSSSPLNANRNYTNGQINDLAEKMDKVETELGHTARLGGGYHMMPEGRAGKEKKEESQLAKINKDSVKLSVEVLQGLLTQVAKDSLFNFDSKSAVAK